MPNDEITLKELYPKNYSMKLPGGKSSIKISDVVYQHTSTNIKNDEPYLQGDIKFGPFKTEKNKNKIFEFNFINVSNLTESLQKKLAEKEGFSIEGPIKDALKEVNEIYQEGLKNCNEYFKNKAN